MRVKDIENAVSSAMSFVVPNELLAKRKERKERHTVKNKKEHEPGVNQQKHPIVDSDSESGECSFPYFEKQ